METTASRKVFNHSVPALQRLAGRKHCISSTATVPAKLAPLTHQKAVANVMTGARELELSSPISLETTVK